MILVKKGEVKDPQGESTRLFPYRLIFRAEFKPLIRVVSYFEVDTPLPVIAHQALAPTRLVLRRRAASAWHFAEVCYKKSS